MAGGQVHVTGVASLVCCGRALAAPHVYSASGLIPCALALFVRTRRCWAGVTDTSSYHPSHALLPIASV